MSHDPHAHRHDTPQSSDEASRIRDTVWQGQGTGPILFARGLNGARLRLAVVLVRPREETPPTLTTDSGAAAAETLQERGDHRLLRYTFTVPAVADAGYTLDGTHYPVNAAFDGDLRIAYVTCNGQEHDDRERKTAERNVLWRRLAEQHGERPFQLLLHGGDQLYADELLDTHPTLRAWARNELEDPATTTLPPSAVAAMRDYLLERYLELYSQPAVAWLLARVPSLAMWDDHDICDGWGSLSAAQLDCPVGRIVFDVAREHFLLLQLGATDAALPEYCHDDSGTTLSWSLQLPGLTLVAPDLRSERRPNRVMGTDGWNALRAALESTHAGHVLVLSSVPALGPRLSWVEAVMLLTPHAQKYEDDLRDQWQSRAHRTEWREFLHALVATHERGDTPVTVISGEIHLATRGTMTTRSGPIHQLVASGIAHPPPPGAYATALSTLARLGESPLPEHPIRLHPLPGKRRIYTAERNYLILERREARWRAWWELEASGPTPVLPLD
ncbi:alkaline phosphatase D family protein [Arhodomonas sp. AD133]|uniref:alkaline phosphatase D family protein n=1 Tax=Arhodomonas sp. AD133 TaxID=3415009 RepID=UPI003EB7EF1E